ncbi:uncharacterized protein EI97DRAFT_457621 [Westerdykella ornata]|uniref:VOC domain-containing protein n=1 Tax=Westerdykella ornata TaxID=318751 RepID=A0A6A6JPM2_WESOR|nr:uncharacterized protein EI97DRAFT_457621 [Westerdykella ornata]KAF2277626.1 hypothetical protein EI97DRAFT_457621 [Westerdykella ornata]
MAFKPFIVVTLAVESLKVSVPFYEALGFRRHEQMGDESARYMMLSEQIGVYLTAAIVEQLPLLISRHPHLPEHLPIPNPALIIALARENPTFKRFIPSSKSIVNAHAATETFLSILVEKREDVDRVVDLALERGGKKYPTSLGKIDRLYTRGIEDPDGHIWQVGWMGELLDRRRKGEGGEGV